MIYQNTDDNAEADLVVGHECEEAVDADTAEHADSVNVVEGQLAAEHQQRSECQTKSLEKPRLGKNRNSFNLKFITGISCLRFAVSR